MTLSALAGSAQDKINLAGRENLQQVAQEAKSRTAAAQEPIEAFVTLNPGWTTEGFEALGAEIVLDIEDDFIIASVPADNMVAFSELPQVKYVEFGQTLTAKLDFARPASQVTELQAGIDVNGTNVAFNGTGVVTGLMDQGIDPNHINFKDADGNPRVMQAFCYSAPLMSCTTPEQVVENFTTDDQNASHGTHVAGIMAGSYNGEGRYVYCKTATGTRVGQPTNGPIPYYGVATGSKIVMASGVFSSTNVAKGVKAVIDYANSIGAPAVVNLSLGSNDGPHDGTDGLTRSLRTYTSKAIICIAAGNEGDADIFIGKKFTAGDTELKTFIKDNKSSGIDIWGNSADPFTVSIGLYNPSTGKLTEVAKVDGNTRSAQAGGEFTTYFSGSMSLAATKDVTNNRWEVRVGGTVAPKAGGRNIAITVTGKDGQQVYCYGYGEYYTSFTSNGMMGYESGTNDGSISGTACTQGAIAVGAYVTRTKWATFSGTSSYANTFQVGEPAPFSSFGETYQGERLPVICAPGANIISSFSRYYTKSLAYNTSSSSVSASVGTQTGQVNFWGAMQGTSMACPYAAGVVATWLQADPTLKAADVIDIMKKTAYNPDDEYSDPFFDSEPNYQWGAGQLMALDGLKEVLARNSAGIDGVINDPEGNLAIELAGHRALSIMQPNAGSIEATLYNLQGQSVTTVAAAGNSVVLDAAAQQPGVYVLQVRTDNGAPVSRRVALQ